MLNCDKNTNCFSKLGLYNCNCITTTPQAQPPSSCRHVTYSCHHDTWATQMLPRNHANIRPEQSNGYATIPKTQLGYTSVYPFSINTNTPFFYFNPF